MKNDKKFLPPPRVLAVHDLSGVGRCALTVIIPTLSVMGYQVVPLPTALLSTHTGGFTGLHFRDLTPDMAESAAHFSKLDMRFGAIYTGFLGSAEQIRTVGDVIDRFGCLPDESGKKPLIFVDPVMGDDGRLYSTYTPELVEAVKAVSRRAEVLTPNLTEACFLTGIGYRETGGMSENERDGYLGELLDELSKLGARKIVVTGICRDRYVENFGTDGGKTFCIRRPRHGVSYPGTGDIFASVVLGSLLSGNDFCTACERAADFICELIGASSRIDTETRYGVALEPHLGSLLR